ncbi:MAG: LptF/LptG family permease [Pseudomonadota bacterium]
MAEQAAPAPAFRHRLPDRLDWYALRSLFGPLVLCLCVLLLALMLARLLSLFDMAAATGASTLLVMKMAATLVPHILGLTVPVAFFAAIFMAVARSGDDSELDVMLATGRSITRMSAPYFLVAVALCGLNFYLLGYLEPVTRYGYELNRHDARQTGWNGRMEDNRFVTVKQGFTLVADAVGADGRQLTNVFVERRDAETEEIITAEHGHLVPSDDGKRLLLELANGMIVRDYSGSAVRTVKFAEGRINEDFTAVPPPFRDRGEDVRELTLFELRAPQATLQQSITAAGANGEFQGRVAWMVLPLLLPLLALPLGMAVKRGRRAPGTVFAALALLALYEALLFGQSMAETGRAPAWVALWLPVLAFAVFGLWLFRSSLQWPGDNPVMRAVSAIEAASDGLRRKKKIAVK